MNKINHILVVLLLLGFLPKLNFAQINEPGFFLDSWVPKTIEVDEFDTVRQSNQPATVNVTIDVDSVVSRVSRYVYGHNAAAWGGKLEQNTNMVKHVKALAPQVIRWPGGSMSDNYFWKATSKASCPKDLPANYSFADLQYGRNNVGWTMSTDSYYTFLEKTNSTGMITVNYGYARLGTGPDPVLTAARYAADWVRYDNGRTCYWEIGNENFGSWENGYKIDVNQNKDGQPEIISGDLYGKHCRIFIDEMRKAAREVGNDIKIGVVAMDSHVTWNNVQRDWNKGMMAQVADLADFIIVHSYYTPYQENSTIATILNSPGNTGKMNQYINDGLKTSAKHVPLPIALTEWNIFAEGSAQQVSYINGMHATLLLGELIKNKYGQGSRWDFMNGWSDGNSHGLFADGEPGITRYTPRAPFFYMYYFQKFFGDRMVYSSVSGSTGVSCFASKFSSGQSGIVLVNKSTNEQTVKLQLNNFNPGDHYYYYLLTGGTDNGNFSRKVYVNGKTTASEGGGPSDYESILPYGASIEGEFNLTLPPLATMFLLVDKNQTLQQQTIGFETIPSKNMNDSDFEISANATSGLPVEFASLNPDVALVENNTVHLVGTGTCEILAFQEGDDVYSAAAHVYQSFEVAKGNQTITFPELAPRNLDDAGFQLPATASSGLACTYESSNPGIALINEDQITLLASGVVTITAKQGGNIDFNPAVDVSQELVIHPKTGIADLSEKLDFSIFPNPASKVIKLKINASSAIVTIYNSVGIQVFSTTMLSPEATIAADEIGAPGMYFVKVNSLVKKLLIL